MALITEPYNSRPLLPTDKRSEKILAKFKDYEMGQLARLRIETSEPKLLARSIGPYRIPNLARLSATIKAISNNSNQQFPGISRRTATSRTTTPLRRRKTTTRWIWVQRRRQDNTVRTTTATSASRIEYLSSLILIDFISFMTRNN